MPRQPILALGLVALALAVGPAVCPARRPPTSRPRAGDQGRGRPPPRMTAGRGRARRRHGAEGEPNILEPAAVAGDLDGRRLPRPAVRPGPVRLEAAAGRAAPARGAPRARACSRPSGPGTRASSSWPSTAGRWPGGRDRSAPCSTRPGTTRRPTADEIVKQGPGRGRGRPGSGPERDIATARDQALVRDLVEDRRPGRLGRRQGARPRSSTETTTAAWSSRPSASCRPQPTAQRPRGGRRHAHDAANAARDVSGTVFDDEDARGRPPLRRGAARRRREGRARSTPCSTSSTSSSRDVLGAHPAVRRAAGLAAPCRRPRRTGSSSRRSRAGPCRSSSGSSGCSTATAGSACSRPIAARGPGDLGPPAEPPAGARSARPSRSTRRSRPRSATGSAGCSPPRRSCTSEVDPALIGGLVVQVGDDVYDASVRNRLAQLRQRLIEGKTHEIQSRRDQFSHSA